MKNRYLIAPFLLGAAYEIYQRQKLKTHFQGKTVLISGGSTGLGFALAKRLLSYGANVSVCGRDENKLKDFKNQLVLYTNSLHTFQCDVASRDKVKSWVSSTLTRFGKMDILINNAGILTVGPFESQGSSLYKESLDIMFWGHFNTTQEVISHLQGGQIVNIISVGGKISIPHMSSYSVAKAAAGAYSEGLGIELSKHGINVTTVYPWLLRTGSYVNGFYPQGDVNEFRAFSLGSALPGISLNVDAAVTEILIAIRNKKARSYIGSLAPLVVQVNETFPGLSRKFLSMVTKILLGPPTTKNFVRGKTMESKETGLVRFFGERERLAFQHAKPPLNSTVLP